MFSVVRRAIGCIAICFSMCTISMAQSETQHDFDFMIGTWKTHIRRLQHPLSGSTTWTVTEGRIVVRKMWNGRANREEIEAESPSGHLEGLTLRLWNPQSKQWALYWANASDGVLGAPAFGEFKNGRGEFYDQEEFQGRAILVRQVYTHESNDAYDFEQAFSANGGRTWEPNWLAHVTRDDSPLPASVYGAAPIQHDFDFNLGTWKTHVSRLRVPLSNSREWLDYDGTSTVTPVWGGRASLILLAVKGATGSIDGMGLRLFNPNSKQWSLHWVNGADGVMTTPMFGELRNDGGVFADQETYRGRAIVTRNSFLEIKKDSARFEQSFSPDNGRTWETNWVMTFSR